MVNETDILISRVVDGRASAEDWSSFEMRAVRDPSLWKELAVAQRDDALLRAEMATAVSLADHVGLPTLSSPAHGGGVSYESDGVPVSLRAPGQLGLRSLRISAWAGWAAAALVAFAFIGPGRGVLQRRSDPVAAINQAGLIGDPRSVAGTLSTDELRDLYVSKGQREGSVIGETPSWVLKRFEQDDNGDLYAVVVRQIVERQPVQDLRRPAVDEWGRAVSVPVRNASFRPPM